MYRICESIRSTSSMDGGVALDVQQGRMFSLNGVASRILELIGQGVCETDIITQISREFATQSEVVECDLREFVRQLELHRLIERVDPA